MNKKKNIWILLLIIVVIMAILLGIGSNLVEAPRKTIRIFSFGNYIDRTLIKDFEREFGIKVAYQTFDSNENMYTKFKLSQSSYDVIIASDYMVNRMIVENLVLKLDKNLIPNFKNIDGDCLNLNFDPKNEYSVPYMMGTVGILYNKKNVNQKINSFDFLFDEKFKKRIFMWDSERDAIGISLKSLGYSMNSKNKSEIDQAVNKLRERKKLVLAYGTDEIRDKMINNEADVAPCYTGEAISAMKENPDLDCVIPAEGSNRWLDSMVISKKTNHSKEAYDFINFTCSADVASKNSEFTGNASPITKARNYDSKFAKYLYLSQDILNKCEIYEYLGEEWQKYYSRAWISVKLS